MREVRRAAETNADYPRVIFFFMAPVETGQQLFQEYWPDAHGVSDPDKFFYQAFGRRRMRMYELLRPGLWLSGLRAFRKGNRQGKVVGDPWQMPGVFLVRGDHVVHQHDYAHSGDHPDFADLPSRI